MNFKNILFIVVIFIFIFISGCKDKRIIKEGGELYIDKHGREYRYDLAHRQKKYVPIADVRLECKIPSVFNFTGAPLIVEKEEYDYRKMAEKFFGTLSNTVVEYSPGRYKGRKENKILFYRADGSFSYVMGTNTFDKPLPFSKEEAQKMVEGFINEYGEGVQKDAELLIEEIAQKGTITLTSHVIDSTVYGLKFHYMHKSKDIVILDDPKYGGDYIEASVNYKGIVIFHRRWRKVLGFKEEGRQNIISPSEALLAAVDNSYKVISYNGYKITNIDIVYHYHCWPTSERKIQVLVPYWRFKCEHMTMPGEYQYVYINAYTKEFIMCPWEKPFPYQIKYRLANVEIEE
ncbi:MAG: two-component system regulatory protein YycI [bacterium]